MMLKIKPFASGAEYLTPNGLIIYQIRKNEAIQTNANISKIYQ
jgi:hypothetical protein